LEAQAHWTLPIELGAHSVMSGSRELCSNSVISLSGWGVNKKSGGYKMSFSSLQR
jgi:hypothetical protein